jgi:high-affinity nickel-transport protein
VILAGIVKVWRAMRRGEYDEAALEQQLQNRGLIYRFFGRWMRTIRKPWQIYPVGVVFGMGFDTATEVALLATTALLASQHVPWYAIMALPILFTAGMTLLDTIDGCFMNLAYGWAFLNPVRKVYYNLTITGLSVGICLFIGGIEVLGLLPRNCTCPAGSGGDVGLRHQQGRLRHRRPVHLTWLAAWRSGASAGSRRSGEPGSRPASSMRRR